MRKPFKKAQVQFATEKIVTDELELEIPKMARDGILKFHFNNDGCDIRVFHKNELIQRINIKKPK